MSEDPRSLRIGERIRILDAPGRDVPGDLCFDEARALSSRLIASQSLLRVHHLDDLGYPWIRDQIRGEGGGWEYHDLMIGPEDRWERAGPENPDA